MAQEKKPNIQYVSEYDFPVRMPYPKEMPWYFKMLLTLDEASSIPVSASTGCGASVKKIQSSHFGSETGGSSNGKNLRNTFSMNTPSKEERKNYASKKKRLIRKTAEAGRAGKITGKI